MTVFEQPLPTYISGFFPQKYEKTIFNIESFFVENDKHLTFDLLKAHIEWHTKNHTFIEVRTTFCDAEIWILFHKYFPFAAIAQKQVSKDFIFMNIPELTKSLHKSSIKVLSKEILEIPVNGHHHLCALLLKDLANMEFAEFAYYEPKHISDIVFNSWKK